MISVIETATKGRFIGGLGPDHTTKWKTITSKTLIEMVIMGRIGHNETVHLLKTASIKKAALRNAIWKEVRSQTTTDGQMGIIKRLFPFLQMIKRGI